MVLHNICIERGGTISKKLNLTVDPITNQRRDRQQIQELLQMTSCGKIRDSSHQANVIHDAITEKLFAEKERQSLLNSIDAQHTLIGNNVSLKPLTLVDTKIDKGIHCSQAW